MTTKEAKTQPTAANFSNATLKQIYRRSKKNCAVQAKSLWLKKWQRWWCWWWWSKVLGWPFVSYLFASFAPNQNGSSSTRSVAVRSQVIYFEGDWRLTTRTTPLAALLGIHDQEPGPPIDPQDPVGPPALCRLHKLDISAGPVHLEAPFCFARAQKFAVLLLVRCVGPFLLQSGPHVAQVASGK